MRGGGAKSWKTAGLAAIAIAVVTLGALIVAAPSFYEVVDKGRDLRPYESSPVYEIRIADTVTFYAAEDSRPNPDVFTGSALVALATAALMAYLILGATSREDRLRRFYRLASIGFALLAADEFFALHETIGHNLPALADLPGIERPDDVVFLLLLVPAVVFVYAFRDILLANKRSRQLFGAAFAAFLLSGVSDVAGLITEEPLELVCGLFIVGGFAILISSHISSCLARPSPDSSA